MKKIILFIILTITSIIIGLTIYFIITLTPKDVSVYSNQKREVLVLKNLKIYSKRSYLISSKHREVSVSYRDLNNVIESIKSNEYFLKENKENEFIFKKNKTYFELILNKKARDFSIKSLEITTRGYPFIDDLTTWPPDNERIYNLEKYNFLPSNNFEGLKQFYKDLKIEDIIIESDKIYTNHNQYEDFLIKKINDKQISVIIKYTKVNNN